MIRRMWHRIPPPTPLSRCSKTLPWREKDEDICSGESEELIASIAERQLVEGMPGGSGLPSPNKADKKACPEHKLLRLEQITLHFSGDMAGYRSTICSDGFVSRPTI